VPILQLMDWLVAPLVRRCCIAALRGACVALAVTTVSVFGAPPLADNDPLGHLLAERGLLSSSAASLTTHRDRAPELVVAALNFLDRPYKWGGSTAGEGFDCSGFTRYMFQLSLGWILPRRAEEQARQAGLIDVPASQLEPGDLVFFNTLRRAFSHVGIYVGDGKFIHAPRQGAEVRVEDMRTAYWARRFDGARRVPDRAANGTVVGGAPVVRPGAVDLP
jgi:cell wall-associated NlpC family hydrolase